MKIIIIGGHHICALVVAKELRKRGHQVFWLGCRFPRWPEKTEGMEYYQVTQEGFPFFDLKTGKFHKNFQAWWKIPFGFFQSFWYLLKIRPQLVLSFGGYLAPPVVLAGWFLQIPEFTHEQTRTAGLANRFMSFFVRKIFLAWEESRKFFPADKTIVVGLPVRPQIIKSQKKKIFLNELPTIMVLGGRQGSHIINSVIGDILEEILTNYNLIHQCGDILEKKDFLRLDKKREKLSKNLKERYLLRRFFPDEEMGQKLSQADFVISRAGAHIVYELAMLSKPAIFIPIPFSYACEQEENAKFFVQWGAGEVIPQEKFNNQTLLQTITKMNNNLKDYQKKAQKLPKMIKNDAAERIADYLEKYEVKD